MKFYIVLGVSFLCIVQNNGDSPIVNITQGQLKGIYQKSRDGKIFAAFLGIPYANKPERLELSEPASNWNGVKDATKFGSGCPQLNFFTQEMNGNEDCLFLNVYSNDLKGKQAVMVYIHGGGFSFGDSANQGASYFADEPVVLVTINYRLSSFGFLSTEDDVIPANLGLKDQLLALKWVQLNIGSFGGDAKKVTLFAESAGGASVGYHILSPASKGLFGAAICQSGSPINRWANKQNPKQSAIELANILGCPTDSVGLKKCFKSKSVNEILAATKQGVLDPIEFAPTTEVQSSHAFITEDPLVLYESGRFNQVPLLITAAEKEGLLIHAGYIVQSPEVIKDLNENWNKRAPQYFFFDDPNISKEAKEKISKRIKKFYFEDKNITKESINQLTDLYSDAMFMYGIRQTALLHGKHVPVYAIMLALDDQIWSHIMEMGYKEPMGMTHADELQYIFTNDRYPKFSPNSAAEKASKYFVKAWATFAQTGNPNFSDQLKGWEPISKDEITSGNLKWLFVKDMKSIPKLVGDPGISKRMHFWDKIYKKLKSIRNESAGKEEL